MMAHAVRSTLGPKSTIRRCPACGHRLDDPETPQCPLCHFEFGGRRVTGDDVTPYAVAFEKGRAGWRAMCEWVWFASTERLKHLALMRSSAASRRFALNNTLLLGISLGLFLATEVGWRWVSNSAVVEPSGSTQPRGYYWYHAASAPRPLSAETAAESPVDLWWNTIQALIVFVSGSAVALLLLWMLLRVLRHGVGRAHRAPYDAERRMTAALHYCTAWWLPVVVGLLVLGFRPLSYVGAMSEWSWYPPKHGFELAAGVVCGLGAILWWFWLIRMGAAAPAKTRGPVLFYVCVGPPVLLGIFGTVWYVGLRLGYVPLFEALRLAF